MRSMIVVILAFAFPAASLAAAPTTAPSGSMPATAPLPAGDAVRGASRFKAVCGTCHTLDPAKKSIGPHLKGVMGRKAGTVAGFNYSAAMKAYGAIWTAANMDPYLAKPGAVVRGTKMVNVVANPRDRADIIAYLATVK